MEGAGPPSALSRAAGPGGSLTSPPPVALRALGQLALPRLPGQSGPVISWEVLPCSALGSVGEPGPASSPCHMPGAQAWQRGGANGSRGPLGPGEWEGPKPACAPAAGPCSALRPALCSLRVRSLFPGPLGSGQHLAVPVCQGLRAVCHCLRRGLRG